MSGLTRLQRRLTGCHVRFFIQIDLNFRHAFTCIVKDKKFNVFISVMSDIGLPDFGDRDLGIDLEKGIFLRGKTGKKGDNDSNDSGNNSMNTNGSGIINFANLFIHGLKCTSSIYSRFIQLFAFKSTRSKFTRGAVRDSFRGGAIRG